MQTSDVRAHSNLELEYEQINENLRFIAGVRFRLLALVPAIGGAAIFILSQVGLDEGSTPGLSRSEMLKVIVVGAPGFLATLGITLYDRRSSELYSALVQRARHLEEQFGVPSTPGGLKELPRGGQFRERPGKSSRSASGADDGLGFALIYGPLLGAWVFPGFYAVERLVGIGHGSAQLAAAALAAVAAVVFTVWLVVLNTRSNRLYNAAARRDGVSENAPAPSDNLPAQQR